MARRDFEVVNYSYQKSKPMGLEPLIGEVGIQSKPIDDYHNSDTEVESDGEESDEEVPADLLANSKTKSGSHWGSFSSKSHKCYALPRVGAVVQRISTAKDGSPIYEDGIVAEVDHDRDELVLLFAGDGYNCLDDGKEERLEWPNKTITTVDKKKSKVLKNLLNARNRRIEDKKTNRRSSGQMPRKNTRLKITTNKGKKTERDRSQH